MRMLCFWNFIAKHVNFKSGKVEETQFCMNFEREIEFSSNKNKVSGQVKMDSYDINNEPFDKCECSVSRISLLNMLNSNRKVKETLEKKKIRKVVFYKTKKVNSLRFVIIPNHFTTVVVNAVNNLFVGF